MPRSLFVALAAVLTLVTTLLGAPRAFGNGVLVTESAPREASPAGGERRPATWSPVRLKSHRVTAEMRDQTAEVTVEQTFHSDADRQLEGTYLFPLPEGAAVGKFAMTMAGKMVEGAVIEASEARRVYQSIVSRRRDPGLLEYMGRGLFQARVFPIEPRSDFTIRLSFSIVLRDDAGTLEFRYPLASDRLNGQPVDEVVVDVRVESAVDIKTVWSPSHEVAITRDGERKARVSFERSGRRQDKDFLLYVGRSPEAVGFSLVSTKPGGEDGTFLAAFAPSRKVGADRVVPKDVVYVLDTSGSMAGEKMEQARRALQQGVALLRDGDRFNVVAFATGLNTFREGLVEANAGTRAAAARWIALLEAVGGTNIEAALEASLTAHRAGRLALVVFITDGKPTVGERTTEGLLQKASSWNPHGARVFTFGVGNDLDVALLDRLAEATRGARDYVAPGEDLELVTGRFFTKVDQPVLTDVTVELGSGVYDVYPQRIPDLFAGSPVVLFGRYRESGERTLVLRGQRDGQEVVHEHRAVFAGAPGAEGASPFGGTAWLPRLWAGRKVAFLLDDIRLHGETTEAVDEVVRLATRHAIVTHYTAGLVVDDAELSRYGRVTSANPLGQLGGGSETRGGAGGSYRGPSGGHPPTTPPPTTPPPPTPPRTTPPLRTPPPTTPPPTTPAPTTPPGSPPRLRPPSLREPLDAGPPPPAPADAPRESVALKRLKEKTGDDDTERRELVRAVGTKSFSFRSDRDWADPACRWVDTAWDGKQAPTRVEAYSEAWMALLAQGDEVAQILALGERVIFVLAGKVYEVVPPVAR